MRILYVTTVGGTMGFFKDLISKLVMQGDVVDIACNDKGRSKVPPEYETLGCKVTTIDCERSPLDPSNRRAIRQIRALVEDGSYDIVHCHTPVAAACTRIACRKARRNGTKVLYTAHGFHFFTGAPLKNWLVYFPVEWICSWMTDVLITINHEDYDRARKRLHARKVVYVPGVGVDIDRFTVDPGTREKMREELGFANDDFVLLSVGELNKNKNTIMVIEALAELKKNKPEIFKHLRYLAVGKGPLKDEMKSRSISYGIEDRIAFLGHRGDVPDLCSAADCFVHPSMREGLAIAPLEAMASGLPLIGSAVRGIQDYSESGVTGVCIDPHSVSELCKAIERIYGDEELRSRCAQGNPEIARRFDKPVATKATLDVYSDVVKS